MRSRGRTELEATLRARFDGGGPPDRALEIQLALRLHRLTGADGG